jgi:hypothetical protein
MGYGLWVNLIQRAEPHHEFAQLVRDHLGELVRRLDALRHFHAHGVALQVEI